MKRIRIGKDISLRWEITTDGAAIPLEGRDLTVEIKSPFIVVRNIPFRVDGNTIIMTYYGKDQKTIGKHSLTLWANKGKPGQNVVDTVNAFELVRTSPEEDDFVNGDMQVETVDLGTANFSILTGGYRAINIDTLRTEASQESVEINGETYSNEGFSVEIPKATTDQAGVMSADDVRTLKEHDDSIAQMKTSLQGHQSSIDSLNTATERHSESISQINSTLQEHTESIASNKTSCEENATEIWRVSSIVYTHDGRLGNIDTKLSSHTASINSINNTLASHATQINDATENIESTNIALSTLQGKVDANTTSISQINTELDNKDSEIAQIKSTIEEHGNSISQLDSATREHSNSIAQITKKLDEHTQSINDTSDIVSGHTSEIASIKSEQTEQNNSISQINSTLADHEERLVYTESDLVKIMEEYDSIISELMKSIGHTQKAFVVETNNSDGHIYIDDVKKIIPANTIKAFRFNNNFCSNSQRNPGISSFRFLVTDTSEITNMYAMFYGCSSLSSLDLSGFDTSAVTNMYAMFYGCSSLSSLDLSGFDTSAVTNMGFMFNGCLSLTSLILGPNFFKTSAVTSIYFGNCSKWTNDTMVASLVTNSYDRAAAGLNTLTLQLHANTKAVLTDEQKAAITNKGYTIA